jgi:hypothetical protein
LKAFGKPEEGPPGPGLFEKCIRRKRNVDGGVLADRFLDWGELALAERRTVGREYSAVYVSRYIAQIKVCRRKPVQRDLVDGPRQRWRRESDTSENV